MINAVYTLTAPRMIEVTYKEIDLSEDGVLIRPTHMSICKADQRYYQGARPKEILKKKLPMALIHECLAKVIFDAKGEFQPGDRVLAVPNIKGIKEGPAAENYRLSSGFRSSGRDGFLQDYVFLPHDRLVRLSDSVNPDVGAFAELISVSMHILTRFDRFSHSKRERLGVWGDGNLGYITALLLSAFYPSSELYIFGRSGDKLSRFSFAKAVNTAEIPQELKLDHCFECVGGPSSADAVNQMIDHINPEGTIALAGVNESLTPLNTRMILERGLRLFGSSRSGREDFEKTADFLEHSERAVILEELIGEVFEIESIDDIHRAFNADREQRLGKTVLHWNK